MGRREIKVLFLIFVIGLFSGGLIYAGATDTVDGVDDFEDVDWQLQYPDVILQDAAAWIEMTAGGLIGESGPAFFFELEPGMHFLIFDGKFHIRLEQDQDPFGSFIRIKNEQVSDYFIETTVRYKELTFNFGSQGRKNGQMVFCPRSDFNRKYVSFDYNVNDWDLYVKSPEWSSWAFDFNSPAISLGPVECSLSADAFLDNSASLTVAVSVGPELKYDRVSVTPFAGYEYSQKFPEILNSDAGTEGRQMMLFGVLGSLDVDRFKLNGGIKYSDALYPFFDVQMGPLELTYGRNLFLANEFRGIKEWTDVYWNMDADFLSADIGFSFEKDHLEEIQTALFADFEFNVLDTIFVDFSIERKDDWLFELGIKYNFKLDFYAESDEK